MNSPNNGSRNRLLAVLSHADRDLLAPCLEVTELDARQILEAPRDPISHVYFVESGLVSVVGTTEPDHRIEVGMVGYEGMTGLCIVLGDDRSATDLVIALAGEIPGMRGVYGGRLRNCGQVEALTANLVSINRRYKAHAGIRVTDV